MILQNFKIHKELRENSIKKSFFANMNLVKLHQNVKKLTI